VPPIAYRGRMATSTSSPDRRAVDRRAARVAVAGALFLGVVVLTVFVHGMTGLDTAVREWLIERRAAGWTEAMKVASTIGSAWVLTPVAVVVALVLAVRGARADALLVALVTLGVLVLGPLLKLIIERPRPADDRLVLVNSWAYPSGHSLTSMAVVGVLTVLAVRHLRARLARVAAVVVGVALVAAVGISRIYLGVHWPTDVLAGWLMGAMWLAVWLILLDSRRARLAS
jgi:membrane-associated phospholipid phosphatase